MLQSDEIWSLKQCLDAYHIRYVEFYEPDLAYELTALAFLSDRDSRPCEFDSLSLLGSFSSPYPYRISKAKTKLISEMETCPQTETQNVLQHGLAVREKTFELLIHLRYGSELTSSWKLPEWLLEYEDDILESLPPDPILHQYTVFHDCGKPACLVYDEEGRKHFPDHAHVSYQTYLDIFGDERVANLIANDMVMHTCKANDLPRIAKIPDVSALLIVSLAEIHANAEMFGGIESRSFKIKYKQLQKRGKALCKLMFQNGGGSQ